jgi:CheY-like chemotaxis protein
VSSQATTTLKVSRVGNGAILYVEDEILNRQAIGALFQQRGYEGTIVENWEQAREAILQVIPVIIFMDLRMPKQDGFEVAKLIREMLGEKTPPIYALTGDATNAVRKKVLDHGFKGLIAKPVRGDELVRIINAEAVSRDDGTSWKSA